MQLCLHTEIFVGEREQITTYRPQRPFVNKIQKDNQERFQSSHRFQGLNEPWSWYDKCTKRHRNHGKLRLFSC